VEFPQTVTLVFDGWTNIHYESVWVFIALLPIGSLILKTVNASADSHTADFIAGEPSSSPLSYMQLTCHPCKCHLSAFHCCVGEVEGLFQDFDHMRFGAIVSDNGGGCQNARKLVIKNHKHMIEKRYAHDTCRICGTISLVCIPTLYTSHNSVDYAVVCRCMMHGYALVMGSVFEHPWARNILKLCQTLVSVVKSSHKLTDWLRVEFQLLRDNDVQHKHLTWLVQAATTRFSSMYICMYSVYAMEVAFKNMVNNHRTELDKKATDKQKAAVNVINNRDFWRDLEALTPVARPFNQVLPCICCHAVIMSAQSITPAAVAAGKHVSLCMILAFISGRTCIVV